MSFVELIQDEAVYNALDQAETEEEFTAILESNGVDVVDFAQYLEQCAQEAELCEGELDDVVGGCGMLFLWRRCIHFWHVHPPKRFPPCFGR